ncbi:MAG: 4Fe-4S binding protein [Candidatus Marinimicrobia bacterium]|nr:4Fe-4S binding protein [Candidatus Neomarinimicrobiota bacterium]MBT4361392.1 4Fe-4S binding protein [Candidatus Neomarinimicrobiota bacterium]MBT4713172.1 4Fe-4S binding protein [Candidatus Neomarinimicrobiota bacterium]MBT4947501.1 4Fe-4S binding protein [Candidatus Neomarinimicrobiota bacterium]MBT5313539.1 4Fe-4S binding protein [Candidatus Neomarinimicrobiota bacterium]
MQEIVVISGKGGTGKTSITASFAVLGGDDIVLADCDVDAADMHLLMEPHVQQTEAFFSGAIAKIDPDLCTGCGLCEEVCRFDAIFEQGDKYVIDPMNCEGCGYGPRVCPEAAIDMFDANVGDWYKSTTRLGTPLVHAKLGIGADNSGKLVTKVKDEAKRLAIAEEKPILLIDGPPGVGCPVVAALAGADYVIIVSEPTVSGIHDLKRVQELIEKFRIRSGCIINKFDINLDVTAEIKEFLSNAGIDHISDIPYDTTFTKAMTEGKTLIEYSSNGTGQYLSTSWHKIKQLIQLESEKK